MIRVIRILEYEFSDNESAEYHMGTFGVPANGTISFGRDETKSIKIRSAIITDLFPKDTE